MNREIITIIKELSTEFNFQVNFLSKNWIIEITKDEKIYHIFGYDWDINSSTANLIAKDKAACYTLLSNKNIPSIEHILFLNPQIQTYIPEKGIWNDILSYAKKYDYNLVCKSNNGSGGNEVFKIKNQKELEFCIHNLFNKNENLALSPFYNIKNEYRVIILKNNVLLIYKKEKPFIIGNGKNSIFELLMNKFKNLDLLELDFIKDNIFNIPNIDEKVFISWKHNLAKGANPIIINEDNQLKKNLISIALKAGNAININFASVDIVEIENQLFVLEINSGIMLENFAKQDKYYYDIAKDVYRNAFKKLFLFN
ncbi:MAG: hypothetical protein U0457_16315 [Candidatus Sericytochromatia bacterium]